MFGFKELERKLTKSFKKVKKHIDLLRYSQKKISVNERVIKELSFRNVGLKKRIKTLECQVRFLDNVVKKANL